MKKLFLLLVMMLTLASCSTDDVTTEGPSTPTSHQMKSYCFGPLWGYTINGDQKDINATYTVHSGDQIFVRTSCIGNNQGSVKITIDGDTVLYQNCEGTYTVE